MDYDYHDSPDEGLGWPEAAQLLYGTWCLCSGASPGALRILAACHHGDGPIDMMDLYRLDPERRTAALVLIKAALLVGSGLDRVLSANQLRRIEEARHAQG